MSVPADDLGIRIHVEEAIQRMIVLGIETSCDETAAAVLDGGRKVLSNVVASQDAIHGPYGGVVPELASRQHTRAIVPVVRRALETAGIGLSILWPRFLTIVLWIIMTVVYYFLAKDEERRMLAQYGNSYRE